MKLILAVAMFVAGYCYMMVPSVAAQKDLKPVMNAGDKVLKFDWPTLQIGTGEYEEGPTGVTVFRFAKRSFVAIDVRGGGPGTVNSDYVRLGYPLAELDAIAFAGGSWYGLEAATAVATALKDDGIRDGNAFGQEPNIAMSLGSIIFDFGPRRLNEVYPDKRLAQAAFRAVRPNVFPLGAHGAGRFAKTGGFFGCNAFSGEGGAFRQIGKLKVAAFVVANSYGVLTRRDGRTAACYKGKGWPKDLHTVDLMAGFPDSRKTGGVTADHKGQDKNHNTTISLVVVNQKLNPSDLQRLAVQVHTSMARAIQPFATEYDGDVLYAVSTAEVEDQVMSSPDLGVVASEVMWDALMSSVPEQPAAATPARHVSFKKSELDDYTGTYVFSPFVSVRISREGNRLEAQATGKRPAYAIGKDKPVELKPVSKTSFMVPGRYPLTLQFDGKGELIINPGHWQQVGKR